jgi:hypothetical protein
MFNIKVRVSAVIGSLQAKFYIHLVELHNKYLHAMGSHVALQYFGNVFNECARVAVLLNKSIKNVLPKHTASRPPEDSFH